MKNLEYFRHGDVTIQKLDNIPDRFKEFKSLDTKKIILALGEVTGHSHRIIPIDDSEIAVFSNTEAKPSGEEDEILFQIKKGRGLLIHEEHAPIILEEGIHYRAMKKQFNPFTNAVENVRD